MLLDLGQIQLDLFHVLSVDLEEHVLQPQQYDGLNEQLEPLALPVLECGAEEPRPELLHRERLAVLARLVANLDQHRDELPRPGGEEKRQEQVRRSPALEVGVLIHGR